MNSRKLKRNLGIVLSVVLSISMSQGKVVANVPERNNGDTLRFCGIVDDKDIKVKEKDKAFVKIRTKRLLP